MLKKVGEILDQYFDQMQYGIKADEVYLTSVVINDQGKEIIDYSQSLTWAIMEKVQADEIPEYVEEFAGIFTEQWTFDPAYRVDVEVFTIEKLNSVGRDVVEYFRA